MFDTAVSFYREFHHSLKSKIKEKKILSFVSVVGTTSKSSKHSSNSMAKRSITKFPCQLCCVYFCCRIRIIGKCFSYCHWIHRLSKVKRVTTTSSYCSPWKKRLALNCHLRRQSSKKNTKINLRRIYRGQSTRFWVGFTLEFHLHNLTHF